MEVETSLFREDDTNSRSYQTFSCVVTCTTPPMSDAATAIVVHSPPNTMPGEKEAVFIINIYIFKCIFIRLLTTNDSRGWISKFPPIERTFPEIYSI